jgi:hypothetical protein
MFGFLCGPRISTIFQEIVLAIILLEANGRFDDDRRCGGTPGIIGRPVVAECLALDRHRGATVVWELAQLIRCQMQMDDVTLQGKGRH